MKYFKKLEDLKLDARGWVFLPISDKEIVSGFFKNPHLASIEPREIRGNHYHKYKTEYIYIFGGEVKIGIKDISLSNSVELWDIDCRKPVILIAKPMIAHAIKNICDTSVYLFCYGTESYDPDNPDVIKEIILR